MKFPILALMIRRFLQLDGLQEINACEQRREAAPRADICRSFIESDVIRLTEQQRKAYVIMTRHNISQAQAAREMGMKPQSFGNLLRAAKKGVHLLKDLVNTTGGDPRMVDEYLCRVILD